MPKLSDSKAAPSKVAKKVPESALLGAVTGTVGNVYYEKSRTVNLGDYNSVKVTVGVDLPIDADKETIKKINATIELGDSIVSEKLSEILKAAVPHERSEAY